MSAASDYLENKVLDHVLDNSAFSQPGGIYLALFTADTGLEGNSPSAEISTSGTAYGRQTVAFAAAGSGSASTNATVTFSAATTNWGTVTHVAVMDAATSGNVLFYGAVTTSKTIETGDTFQVSSGNLTVSLA
jgi:hypothetical protein|tara:strand:+ start:394 stop:792 length:399 start_codon:yes stop_codon:yes gene_type:complete